MFLVVQLSEVEPDVWSTECNRLQELLQNKKYSSNSISNGHVQVTGLCYCAYNGASVAPTDLPLMTVYGDTTLREIMEMKGNSSSDSSEYSYKASFDIAPNSFFQVSSSMCYL